MSATGWQPRGPVGRFINEIEETAIAVLLFFMVGITFVNVVLRYGFNDSLIWGQEVVLILFAWLVMFGVSYAVKVTAHLGVDAVTNLLAPGARRAVALIAAACCLAYAALLLKGAWDFWANFANLPQTTGRWFPTGFQEMRLQDFRGYTPTVYVPIPEWSRGLLEGWLLLPEDDPYEKLPRTIPYVIVPLGAALLLFRFIQATLAILRGDRDGLIVSHEAEEAIAELSANPDMKDR